MVKLSQMTPKERREYRESCALIMTVMRHGWAMNGVHELQGEVFIPYEWLWGFFTKKLKVSPATAHKHLSVNRNRKGTCAPLLLDGVIVRTHNGFIVPDVAELKRILGYVPPWNPEK